MRSHKRKYVDAWLIFPRIETHGLGNGWPWTTWMCALFFLANWLAATSCRAVYSGSANWLAATSCRAVYSGSANWLVATSCRAVYSGSANWLGATSCRAVYSGSANWLAATSCRAVYSGSATKHRQTISYYLMAMGPPLKAQNAFRVLCQLMDVCLVLPR